MLALVGGGLLAGHLAFNDDLSSFVQLQLDDDAVGWVHTDEDHCTVALLTLNAFNVQNVLLAEAAHNLADLLRFVMTADHLHFVVLANWHGLDVVLLTQFARQTARHDLSANVRWCVEVRLAHLTTR